MVTRDSEQALRLMQEERPHLALLDLMLPGTDDIGLTRNVLKIANVPVIFMSSYGQEENITLALDTGAVDYVVKPFSPTELGVRTRAALGDSRVPLVAMEYRVLAELAANAGRVLTYERLLKRVWGEKSGSDVRPIRTAPL